MKSKLLASKVMTPVGITGFLKKWMVSLFEKSNETKSATIDDEMTTYK